MLDVGCGAGDNAQALQSRGVTVDGITLSESEARSARAFCNQVDIYNLENGLPDTIGSGYDAVICSHVLEHICFPTSLLNGIRDRLTEEGILIVALPNFLWWKNRLRLLRGKIEYEASGLMDNTHFKWYTFRSSQKLLCDHGFEVTSAQSQGGAPLGPLRRIVPARLCGTFDETCCRILPGLFGYQLLLTAKKL